MLSLIKSWSVVLKKNLQISIKLEKLLMKLQIKFVVQKKL
jgi:hypothetical protein